MSKRWEKNYSNFLKDVGLPPASDKAISIDRIKNRKGYIRGNVRWASVKTQQRNKTNSISLKYKDEIKVLPEWAEILNIPYYVLYNRIKILKWDVSRAIETPYHKLERKVCQK